MQPDRPTRMTRRRPLPGTAAAWCAIVLGGFSISTYTSVPARASELRFVGEGRCANPTCHGAPVAESATASPELATWKWARTLWADESIDRHSRAFRTLQTKESAAIANYMGLGEGGATSSTKCLVCHAPEAAVPERAARLSDGQVSTHQRAHGVSCEHCHGAAEAWLEAHSAADWPERRASFRKRGFVDLNDFRVRAEMCASCHVEIDHEIVAAGHPPLQFEMVAYAQLFQHWNDLQEHPGDPHPNPTLWLLGQVVGLRSTARMVARRAGDENYQALGRFEHFAGQECYRCHHKLVDDAMRQAAGHWAMLDIALPAVFPDLAPVLGERWRALEKAVASGRRPTVQRAEELSAWLDPIADRLRTPRVSRTEARKVIEGITSRANSLGRVKRFSKTQDKSSRAAVLSLRNIESPWWWTTGAPEQACLAIDALCRPALGDSRCSAADARIGKLFEAVNRFDYDERSFVRRLDEVGSALLR